MKNPFIPLLIIGLLLFASFGLVMMGHTDGQGHNDCPLQPVAANDCTKVQGPLGFITSHLNAVSKFFSAIPVKTFVASALYLLAVALAALVSLNARLFIARFSLASVNCAEAFVPLHRPRFHQWSALHENSPTFIGRRLY